MLVFRSSLLLNFWNYLLQTCITSNNCGFWAMSSWPLVHLSVVLNSEKNRNVIYYPSDNQQPPQLSVSSLSLGVLWSRWPISIYPSLWPHWLVQSRHMIQADSISCYPWMVIRLILQKKSWFPLEFLREDYKPKLTDEFLSTTEKLAW